MGRIAFFTQLELRDRMDRVMGRVSPLAGGDRKANRYFLLAINGEPHGIGRLDPPTIDDPQSQRPPDRFGRLVLDSHDHGQGRLELIDDFRPIDPHGNRPGRIDRRIVGRRSGAEQE